jgi:hypothetical protein
MPILTLLFQHREFIAILLLLLGLWSGFEYVKYLHSEMITLKSENVTLATNLITSNNSIKTLQTAINQQNTAVDQLKAAADARVQSHAIEISAANAKAETYRQQALDIMKLKSTGTDKCASASALINSEVAKNAKK